jgi:ABC-type polysaccharide/polyol phosphate export permease
MNTALKDFVGSFKLWHLFIYLGWEDIYQRYVRTLLGPFWLTLGHCVWIGAMAVVMGSLFNNSIKTVLPFIAAGTLVWTFIASVMNESCQVFINAGYIITSINLPISLHIFRLVVRNFIIFLHNLVVLVLIVIFCNVSVNLNTLLVIPALIILMINSLWIATLIGVISTRYRDIQQIIMTSTSILPFITPIFWEKSFLKKHLWIANINPFYHMIEIVRSPLLGQQPSLLSWQIIIVITILGILFTLKIFNTYKHRIIYWL